jgi:CRISPR-associated protein Csx3
MTNKATSRFPAILIGGPPHAGKSVLSHSLKEALKKAGVQCYLLRAAPDGEGDWSQEAEPDLAQTLRRKGTYTPVWVERMCRDIAYRPLPFLVDVGGKPKAWQETIFDQCTHAILLVKNAKTEAFWQAMVAKYNLLTIAVLTSQLQGKSVLQTDRPVVRGVITNLHRGQSATGPLFDALLARVQALFNYDYDELLTIHGEQAPVDLVVDISRLYRKLNPAQPGTTWYPHHLTAVFDELPQDSPLGLYGIGPAWLYAAVANYIFPNQFYQFDARRGWVEPTSFKTSAAASVPLDITAKETEQFLFLHLDLSQDYLNYRPEIAVPIPAIPTTKGVILSGKLPNWLYTGLTLFYRHAPWVALYYPHLNQAIIISTHNSANFGIGQCIDMAAYDYLLNARSPHS